MRTFLTIAARWLGYLAVASLAAWLAGWWAVEDCTRDHSGPGEDAALCGLGFLLSVPVFVGALVVVGITTEVVLSRRRAG